MCLLMTHLNFLKVTFVWPRHKFKETEKAESIPYYFIILQKHNVLFWFWVYRNKSEPFIVLINVLLLSLWPKQYFKW